MKNYEIHEKITKFMKKSRNLLKNDLISNRLFKNYEIHEKSRNS